MHRVEVVPFCIAASRNADIALHLATGEQLSKIFSPRIASSTRGSGRDTSQICMVLEQFILTNGMNLLAEVSQSARMESAHLCWRGLCL